MGHPKNPRLWFGWRGRVRHPPDDYALTVSIPGRKDPPALHLIGINLPKDSVITISDDKIPFEKMLYKQTSVPIENGDAKQGVLIFQLAEDRTFEYLNQYGTIFVLTCKDVNGNTITSKREKLTGINEGHRHYIGLE